MTWTESLRNWLNMPPEQGSDLMPEPPVSGVLSHTVIRHNAETGATLVQHFGAGHIVAGSERILEVPAGETVVIRRVAARP